MQGYVSNAAERVADDAPAATESFVPADLAHGVALELVQDAAEKGVWLDSAIDPSVPARARGDVPGVRRVLRTMAGHALRVTDRGQVALSLTAEPDGTGRCTLVFSITDGGPRLPPKRLDELLAPVMAGVVGLAGCEGLPKGGNRVWLAVPAEIQHDDHRAEDPAAHLERLIAWSQARGGHVLVVDDSTTNRIIAAALLRKAGFDTTLTEGGAEAVSLAASAPDPFDAVLMDVAMPDMDGLAATAAIRALPAPRARVPVIAMTAHAFPEDRERCLAAGMDDYVAKPFQLVHLLEALARQLA